jgi:mannose-6-phosphate isomerase-like protein (cupin superfamily)
MADVIKMAELPASDGACRFEGGPYGADLSFFLIESEPGQGPELHSHPYGEVFVVRGGHVRFSVDGKAIDAEAGDIVVARAESEHRFVNSGPGRLDMINIHASGDMITRWLTDAH